MYSLYSFSSIQETIQKLKTNSKEGRNLLQVTDDKLTDQKSRVLGKIKVLFFLRTSQVSDIVLACHTNKIQIEMESICIEAPSEAHPMLTMQTKVNSPKKDNRIRIEIRKTHEFLLRQVSTKDMGWRIWGRKDPRDAVNVYWRDDYVDEDFVRKLKPYQRVNHFPSSEHMGRKNLLTENLNRLKKSLPNDFTFYPPTFTLPSDLQEYQKYAKTKQQGCFIVKPHSDCQGRGIYLLKAQDQPPSGQVLVQQYLQNPLLIEGAKFDLRIYVLIKSLSPLKIYVYQEGLCRLATVPYQKPTPQNWSNTRMHLTNYAINQTSPDYIFNKSQFEDHLGHKRSLSSAMKTLAEQGADTKRLTAEIDAIIVKTIMACSSPMLKKYREARDIKEIDSVCFQLVGFDILVLDDFTPVLLEVNHHPSLGTDTPLDQVIKRSLLIDTLSLIAPNHDDKIAFFKQKWDQQVQMSQSAQAPRLFKDRYASGSQGCYRKIFPLDRETQNCWDYANILKTVTIDKPKVKVRVSDSVGCGRHYSQTKNVKLIDRAQRRDHLIKEPALSLYNVIKNARASKLLSVMIEQKVAANDEIFLEEPAKSAEYIMREQNLAFERNLRREKARQREKRKEITPLALNNVSIHYDSKVAKRQEYQPDNPFKIHSFLNMGAFQQRHPTLKNHRNPQPNSIRESQPLEPSASPPPEMKQTNAFSLELKRRIERMQLAKINVRSQRKSEGERFVIRMKPLQAGLQGVGQTTN